jgi:hypothetical protein
LLIVSAMDTLVQASTTAMASVLFMGALPE